MGKASRIRRQKKDADRQRRRAARGEGYSGGRAGGYPGGHGWSQGPRELPSTRELVSAALGAAIEAVCHGDKDTVSEYLDLLANTQIPGWAAEVSTMLAGALRLSVAAAWRHGWQPAELARHAGRELGEAHSLLAAGVITEEMRCYAAATVDYRWAAQVSALGAEVFWQNDAVFLDAWSTVEPQIVRVAVELLHLMQHLQVLEQLCPLPGTARAGQSASVGEADERVLGKIRALLAKAESTEFPEEAEALSARAQELMAKYSIDHALLAAQSGNKDKPVGRRLPVDNPYESPKATLLHVVAKANRCRAVWQKAIGMSTVIGFGSDLDAVELLFMSLLVQANAAMVREGAKRDANGRSRTRAFRQSFLVAYAHRIGERLSQVTDHAEQEAVASSSQNGQNLLPVLKARHEAIDDAVDEIFGVGGLVHERGARVSDKEGWHSGLAAADMANLHNREQVPA